MLCLLLFILYWRPLSVIRMNILHTVFCANGLHQINWVKILNNFQSRPQTFSYINISNFHYKLLFRKCFVTTTSPVGEGKSNKMMNRSSLIFLLRFIYELRNKTFTHCWHISENWNTRAIFRILSTGFY